VTLTAARKIAEAALSLREQLDAQLDVHIVVHQGPAVAATIAGRLDYFGQSVESALDLCAFAAPSAVLLSSEVAEDPHVIAELTAAGHTLELMALNERGSSAARVLTAYARSA
jgi:class 3 adenylate cyclase